MDTSYGLSGSTYPGQDEASNTFDSGASARTFSDTSSTCESIASNVSPRARHSARRNRNTSPSTGGGNLALTDESSWDAEDVTPTTAAPKQKGSFTCGFCLEEGIQKTCTRKNDLKRHMEDFHHTDAQWFCRHRGCHMVFDWQTAYKAHLKSSHGGSRMNLDDAKVALCTQTVFACGFENCLQVFEAASDAEAPATFKEYVGHVVKHFDEGASSGQWSYSARMRNLLRQSGVLRAWSHSMWPEADQSRLRWQAQSSSILRKRLETKHIGDIQFLIQYAIALGSSPGGTVQSYRADFVTPIRSDCQMAMTGHINNKPGVSPTSPTSETEQPQYRMSHNGNSANPALAAYYASQHQAYAISQQPTQAHLQSGAAGFEYTFHNAPPSPSYDSHHQQQQQQQQQHHHHPHPHHQYALMGHSLGDTPMGGADYTSHGTQNLPGPYGAGGLHSPAPTDICGNSSPVPTAMDHGSSYTAYESAAYAY